MDYINDYFTVHANNQILSPAIKASLGLSKKTLNRYYSLTDSSNVYHIAMGASCCALASHMLLTC